MRVFINRLWLIWVIEALVIVFMVSLIVNVWVWLPLLLSSGVLPFIAGWRIQGSKTGYVMGAIAGMSLGVISVIVQVGESVFNGSLLEVVNSFRATDYLEALIIIVVLTLLPQAIFGLAGGFVHGRVSRNA